MNRVFVTGASGNVGRDVVAALSQRGVPMVIGERSTSTARTADGQSSKHFDFLDPGSYLTAVNGCSAVFLLRPPAISNTKATLNRFIDVARSAGVEQIVFISVAGAASNPIVPHHAVELHLRTGPAAWTILRPGFFSQNLQTAYLEDILVDDRIYVPAGSGQVTFVDTRDIAAVAVDALLRPEVHSRQAYTLTGAEALSFLEVADLLSGTLGRPILYQPAAAIGYVYHLLNSGHPLAQALVQTVLHVGIRFGQAAHVDPTLARLLDRKPLTMAEYVRDYRHAWIV